MMKKQILVFTAIILIMTLSGGYILWNMAKGVEQRIFSEADYLFQDALKQDYKKRMEKNGEFYLVSLTPDWPYKDEVTYRTEAGVRVLKDVDSLRRLPVEEKVHLMMETSLLETNAINPDTLKAHCQDILKRRSLDINTAICYKEADNQKTLYSENDMTFFTSAYLLKEYKTGLFNEVVVQAYVKVPLITLIEKGGARLFIPVLGWMLLIVFYATFLFHKLKRKPISPEAHSQFMREQNGTVAVDIIEKQLPTLDIDKCHFSYKHREIDLPPVLAQLMFLFLSKPDYFVTKEEIAVDLWKGLNDNSNRISQIIKRLRSALAGIPEIEIENIPRVGFRLIFH